MPDSAGTIEEIHNSLKVSLSGGRPSLDDDIAAGTKRVLLHNIEFEPASKPYSVQRDELRVKYNPMNTATMQGKVWGSTSTPNQHQATSIAPSQGEKNGDVLPIPRVVLYPEEKIKMEWSHMTRIGAGLLNLGNTCFFNSTLQCLTYTAPLVNYCYTSDHKEKCRKKDFCMMCEIQKHIRISLNSGGRPIKPHSILQKLRCIAKHMKWGRQEDAHEFLRFVVDHLQQSCLNGESNKLDRFSKETTVINQIFGGFLQSQVTCLKCQGKSNTFDPFMDLSLDIKGVNSVEEALAKYVKPETLDFDNAYLCPRCKTKVRAQKRFSIRKTPNILTLQLNRFDFNRHLAGKMTKFINYKEKINLRNYMSQRHGDPVMYHLYGVIVHSGYSSDHGHYYSYVKSPTKTWFCMNDASVNQANMHSVFNADAYVLFYARINKGSNGNSNPSTPNSIHSKSPAATMKGPYSGSGSANHVKHERSPVVNGIHSKPSSELGTPIKREVPSPSPKIVPHATPAAALPGSNGKISFPILTAQQRKQQLDGKRIVLQIKDGNSTTMEKSPDGKSKLVNGGRDRPLGCLVPYRDDDSDSEQENNNGASFRHHLHAAGDGPGKIHGGGKKTNGGLPSHGGDADGSKSAPIKARPVTDQAGNGSPKKSSSASIPALSSCVKDGGDAGRGPPCLGKSAGRLSPLALAPVVGGSVSTTSSSWCVQPQDPVPSPRGSCSSTNSVNSTTEWHVEGKDAASTGGKPNSKHSWENRHNLTRKLFSSSSSTSTHTKEEPKLCQNGSGGESHSAKQETSSREDELPRCVTPVDISDRQALLSPSSSENSSKKAKKHKKKHKKKWKDSQSSKDSQEDSSSRSDSSHKKKKKHKHKKEEDKPKKHSDRSWDDSNDSASSSGEHCHLAKKKCEDKEKYEWVERKVSPSPKHKHKMSNKATVVEQRWNSQTHDDVAPRKSEDTNKLKGKASWDGTRTAKVANYLGSSQYGLGAVQSWEGGNSHVGGDQSSSSKKRHWAEDYNEDIDAGKVKKVKKQRDDDGFNNHNPFQNHFSSKKHHWNDDHSYHAPPKPVRYRDQPWLNSDFDPRPYQIKASSHY